MLGIFTVFITYVIFYLSKLFYILKYINWSSLLATERVINYFLINTRSQLSFMMMIRIDVFQSRKIV